MPGTQNLKTATGRNKQPPLLVGYGYDVHNLSKDARGLVLAGVCFADDPKIIAHSDGDIVFHAVANAILGALGLGDIGTYFSDRDKKNKGMDSVQIMTFAIAKMTAAKYRIGNVDVQLVAQNVMVSPKRPIIVSALGAVLDCPMVNVKGTRWEKPSNQVACHVVLTLFKG